ncbi:hypothetical protein J2T17_004351 [Paenibacillus mucilaginosus]|uniref:hypothetical protein n=1 Tax=Paenibacillus mucilaginosus TaxID=61624 RepID=UPI003D25DE13
MKSQFKAPSRHWRWFIYPAILILILANIGNVAGLMQTGSLSIQAKLSFSIEVSLLFGSCYLLMGFRYLSWAADVKNQLYQVALENRLVFLERHNRIFINEDACRRSGADPIPFTKLRQSDIQEVMESIRVV